MFKNLVPPNIKIEMRMQALAYVNLELTFSFGKILFNGAGLPFAYDTVEIDY